MKLILTNFRCFKNLSLDLSDTGVVLLWGTSGIGKTTVFKAIHFVLYGKEQKIVSFGEKKCKVEFSFTHPTGEYTICRTKGPTHLTLKRVSDTEWSAEDDVAQQKIYELFGRDFLLTSYMAQKGIESFFNLSNNEKATFLQNLSLKDFDVESIRKKIKEVIRQRKDKLISIQTKLSMLERTLSDDILTHPKLKIDLKGKTVQEYRMEDEALYAKLKKFIREKTLSLSRLQKEYSELCRLQNEYDISQSILEEKTLQYETVKNKLSTLHLLSEDEIDNLTSKLNSYTNLLVTNGIRLKLEEHKEELERMIVIEEERKQKEIQTVQTEIDNISQFIISEESEVSFLTRLSQSIREISVIVRDVKLSCDTAEEIIEIDDILSENIETTKEKLLGLGTWDREKEYMTLKAHIQTIQQNILQLTELITKGTTSGYHCPKCNVPFYIDKEHFSNDVILPSLGQVNPSLGIKNPSLGQVKLFRSEPKVLREELEQLKYTKRQNEEALEQLEQERITFRKREEVVKTKCIKLQTIYNSFLKIYNPIREELQTIEEPFETLFERLNQHRKYSSSYSTLLLKLQTLQKLNIHQQKSVLQKQQQIKGVQSQLDILSLELLNVDVEDKESITLQIDNCKEQLTIHKQTLKIHTDLQKERNNIQKEIENISKLVCRKEEKECLQQTIKELETNINLKQNNMDKLEIRLKKISDYERDLNEYQCQQELFEQIKNCKNEERLILRGISKAELLLRRVGDAESLSLQQTIDRINSDIEEYITAFFDDTCTAHLTAFKETKDKDKKSLIDIQFSRNGEEVSIDSLSGGEYDRLALALFLSFGSQSPIMMLDECLASLHSELVEEIIEKIKEKMGHKLVLFTLHQANTGIFDHIIDVEKLTGGCCRQL